MTTQPYQFLGDTVDTQSKATHLRAVPLLASLSDDYVTGIARHAAEIHAEPDEVLLREGEAGQELAVILEGTVRVEQGGRKVAQLGPGNFFGEMALIDGKPRSASIVAETPVSLLTVNRDIFVSMMDSDPVLVRTLLLVLTQRLRGRGEDPTA